MSPRKKLPPAIHTQVGIVDSAGTITVDGKPIRAKYDYTPRPVPKPKRRQSTREERLLREHLRELTGTTTRFLVYLDALMKLPASSTRDAVIARVSNALDLRNDLARRFGLKQSARVVTTKPAIAITVEELPALLDKLRALASWEKP